MYSNSEISEAIKLMAAGKNPSDSALAAIVSSPDFDGELSSLADRKRREVYSDEVYLRGLIEISSYCRNNCYYCGLRAGNAKALRYRLSKDEILDVCNEGYGLGFRTFVLQGGEDPSFTDSFICDVISSIKKLYPDCAVTLSIGERDYSSYKAFFDAGADRYLLRHETADEKHYRMLHPESMSLQKRKECLFALKEIGYQVGSGFMVGSPYQTVDNIVADLRFLQQLSPVPPLSLPFPKEELPRRSPALRLSPHRPEGILQERIPGRFRIFSNPTPRHRSFLPVHPPVCRFLREPRIPA